MASKTVIHSVPPSKPASVVTQLELTLLLSLRGRLNQLQQQVDTAEHSVRRRLEAGACVEPGDLFVGVRNGFRFPGKVRP